MLNTIICSQFAKYLGAGGVATLADWGIFYALAIKAGVHYQAAVVASFFSGSVTNYVLNKIFTFRCKSRKILPQLYTHLSVSAVSLLLTMALMYVLVGRFGLWEMTARILTSLIMLVLNFFMHKHITFNKRIFT